MRLTSMEALHVVLNRCFDPHICPVIEGSYEQGYADGYAAREAEFEGLQRQLDYWYFRACNPGVKTADQKMIESIIQGMEVNEERRKKFAALDAAEAEMFEEARALLAQGKSDIEVATEVGLFLPIVENLRTGVL